MKKSDISKIAEESINDGSQFYNPESFSIDEVKLILKSAWVGNKLNRNKIMKNHQK